MHCNVRKNIHLTYFFEERSGLRSVHFLLFDDQKGIVRKKIMFLIPALQNIQYLHTIYALENGTSSENISFMHCTILFYNTESHDMTILHAF